MLINAEREALESLDPRLDFWWFNSPRLADGTSLDFLGISQGRGGGTTGKVIVLGLANPIPYKRKHSTFDDCQEARTCDYAVLLRKPSAEELAAWTKDSGREDLSPLVFELLRLRTCALSKDTVFERTGKVKVWAQPTIT